MFFFQNYQFIMIYFDIEIRTKIYFIFKFFFNFKMKIKKVTIKVMN